MAHGAPVPRLPGLVPARLGCCPVLRSDLPWLKSHITWGQCLPPPSEPTISLLGRLFHLSPRDTHFLFHFLALFIEVDTKTLPGRSSGPRLTLPARNSYSLASVRVAQTGEQKDGRVHCHWSRTDSSATTLQLLELQPPTAKGYRLPGTGHTGLAFGTAFLGPHFAEVASPVG
jgi:hypothetical protein